MNTYDTAVIAHGAFKELETFADAIKALAKPNTEIRKLADLAGNRACAHANDFDLIREGHQEGETR